MKNLKTLPKTYPHINKHGMVFEKRHIDFMIRELRKVSKDSVKIVTSVIKNINYFKPDKDSTNLDRQMIGFAKHILRNELKRPDTKSTHFSNVIETFGKSEIEVENLPDQLTYVQESELYVHDFRDYIKKTCGHLVETILVLLIEGYSKDEIRGIIKVSGMKLRAMITKLETETKRYFNNDVR